VGETIRLGTIAGVRVGVNWSVLVIAGLLFSGLAFGQFPHLYPDHGSGAHALAGLVGATVFLASLLAHELAHAVVARRHGVEVEGITLWMLGGVAKLLGEASNPRADLRIAAVGPLTSLALGAGFWVFSTLAVGLGIEGLVVGLLQWLALINVVLAVFNLIPAAPLDGGRILRAVLWQRHGDRFRAAVVAAQAGRRFGFLMVALGVAMVVMLPGIGGLWFALVGWFISSAASAEEQHTRVRHSLRDLSVADVMTPQPVTAPSGMTVDRLVDDVALRHRCSAFPVVDGTGNLAGLVTLHRIRAVEPARRGSTTVDEVACPAAEVVTAARTDRLVDVLPGMTRSEDRRLVVLDDGRVVGIVSSTDVARALELLALSEGPGS